MWTYEQTTGRLSRNGVIVSFGHSGDGDRRNDPDAEHLTNRGPIPRGRYRIGDVVTVEGRGPVCIDLHPVPGQNLHGRGGFLIHGDEAASHGCIILGRRTRQLIAESDDRELEVIR